MEPDVRYAHNGSVAIAYETFGDGPMTLVCLSPFDNLEIVWENPLYARYLRRLGDLARVVLMDRRGTGLSDRFSPGDVPPLEDLVDDITVVLDACECERAVLFGFEEAAAQCAMFAAGLPDRVAGLVLYAATACGVRKPDYPWQWSEEEWESYLEGVQTGWGTSEYARETLGLFMPSHVGDGRMGRRRVGIRLPLDARRSHRDGPSSARVVRLRARLMRPRGILDDVAPVARPRHGPVDAHVLEGD